MHIIEKLRDIWTRYGGWFNSLSPYELDEFIHSAWILVLLGGVLACMVTFLVATVGYDSLLLGTVWLIFF